MADRTVSANSIGTERVVRVAYLVSHPIQYQAPMLKRIAALPSIDLKVFFQSDISTRTFFDTGFGRKIEWDVPLLDGYNYEFLRPALFGDVKITNWRPYNRGLLWRLWKGKYDILWVHGYYRPYNIAVIIAASFLGVKVLIRDEATSISKDRIRRRDRGKTLMMQLFVLLGARYLAIGSLNGAYYEALGVPKERIFLMPYCVDNIFFQERIRDAAARRETLRRELGIASGVPIILYASKFERRKRPDDLIAAHRLLAKRTPAATVPYLLMAGEGEIRQALEDEVRKSGDDRILFLGFQNQKELPRLYDLCDVFVLPSVGEPWGLVVNEVMNASKAVIVTDQVGCAPDLIKNAQNGFIIPAQDPEALAEALYKVVCQNGIAEEMGRQSIKIINEWNFDRDTAGLLSAIEAALR